MSIETMYGGIPTIISGASRVTPLMFSGRSKLFEGFGVEMIEEYLKWAFLHHLVENYTLAATEYSAQSTLTLKRIVGGAS